MLKQILGPYTQNLTEKIWVKPKDLDFNKSPGDLAVAVGLETTC